VTASARTTCDVPYVDFAAEHAAIRAELLAAVQRVLDHGGFILGSEVEEFEARFAEYCGVRHAVGVASGTAALTLALQGLGVGPSDEVITVPNSFVATVSSIVLTGARPVLVDVLDDFTIDPERIEAAVTARTRAIVPVHLTGRPADMERVTAVARRHGLAVVEDAAQAVGAEYRGRRAGALGHASAFSLHPLKNLGAAGDGGVVTTDDDELADWLRKARNHGLRTRDECAFFSPNERLDALHAAMLRVKLGHLEEWTERRRHNAAYYCEHLEGLPEIRLPRERAGERCVYHTFVVEAERRDTLRAHLAARGVETKVHYPVPIHLQPAASGLGYQRGSFPVAERQAARILSLPVHPWLSEEQLAYLVGGVREFYGTVP
jgi:dTDP-4-amino-4,6-dideoxygalactose transaminase